MTNQKDKPYHHGNVRSALIEAAVDALRSQSFEAVSLRKLAQTIGVSHNAPYMHFPDKEALWRAISDTGFERLSDQIKAASNPQMNWRERLNAGCRAYVRFAETHREYMLVMFRAATPGVARQLSEKGTEALQILGDEIARAKAEGHLIIDDPRRFTVLIWTMLHGLTMMQLQLGDDRGPLQLLPQDDRVVWMLDQLLIGAVAQA